MKSGIPEEWRKSPLKAMGVALRVIGAITPLSAAMVQLESERAGAERDARIAALENPMSALNPLVPKIAKEILKKARESTEPYFSLKPSKKWWEENRRGVQALEAAGVVESIYVMGQSSPANIRVSDPAFLVYAFAEFGDRGAIDAVLAELYSAENGARYNGSEVSEQFGVPVPVVHAGFELFERLRHGLLSKEIGSSHYIAK